MMGLSVYYRISFLLLWTFLAVHLPAQTWSAQQAYFGWFGDNPRTTPNATVISAGSFATASVMSGGTGVVFTSTQDGVATVFKADNINSTSMATAITNGDYIKATLSIPAGNPKIRFTYASLVGTIGTWSGAYTYGMTVTDLATGVSTTVFQNVSVPTTQTNVPQTLATPYEMIPGKNYEVRWYMYDASFSSSGNVTRALDNPVLYFEVLTCYTTATPPALSVTTKSNVCPTTTVDLTTITANNTPANTVLEWHSGTPVTAANKVATPSAVVGGTYYAVFYDAVNNCYSNTTSVTATSNVMTTPPVLSATTQSNVCPATTIDLTGISSNNTPIGTVLEWHSGLPLSTANKIVTPNAVGVGTYYATFYDAGNDCYSPYTLVKAVSNSCMPISVSNICPATTIDLTSINSGNTPPDGTVLEWHSGLPLSIANKIATPNTVLAGTYYATFYDAVSDCYSPPALVTAIANPCTPVTITNICPTSTIDLTSFSVGNMPTGTVLEWHSDIPLSIANKIATPKAVLAGTYYATFYDAVSDCYSPPALVTAIANPCPPVTITNICPTSTIDLTSFSVGNMPTGTVLEWHSGLPLSVANKILAPNAVSAGTYYATFYDAVSDCYSPPTLVTGTSNPCQTVTINNVCTSQSVFYSQTFGAGTGIGAALPAAQIPSYTYNSNNFTVDGQYTIIQNPRNGLLFGSNSPWLNGADHTGDVNGRMLLVNGSSPGQIAYNQPVTGLVIGRTYAVRTFIANVIDATTGSYPLLPNINFYIKDASNNTLATTSTGDIPISPTLTWLQKEMSFVATTTSVTFQLVSNNTSGNGNDFALDDITFYEKVEPLLSSTSTTVSCPAKTANLSTVTVGNLPFGARLSWHSGTPATAANELTNIIALPAGTYYAAFTDGVCYSNPIPFTVNVVICPCPTVSIGSSASTTCSGGNVTLTATTTGLDPTCQLQWQNSLDGVTWSNIVGANTSIYIVTALMTTMKYRAIIFCPNNNCCN